MTVINKDKILYVDDEKFNLTTFKSEFRKHYEVFTAISAKEGLRILQEQEIPVIIADQRMPEMTGVEFLELVLAKYPNAIRIILTGYSDILAAKESINKGRVYRYIEKPYDEKEVKRAIDNALESFHLKKENKRLVEHLKEANHNLELKVQERTAELKKKNRDITASINYAKRIQLAILPKQENIKRSINDFFIMYEPRDIVSGDFYWHSEIDDKIVIAAADCTGHGVPGAFMSMIGDSYFNHIVNIQKITNPNEILSELHRGVFTSLKQQDGNSQDGMDVVVCVIDKNDRQLLFAGAKNPLLYVQNGEIIKVKGDRHPVGGLLSYTAADRDFILHRFPLEKGTTFYLFSDGYQDQFGGPDERKFMTKKFRELLYSNSHKPMEEQKSILQQTFSDWKGDFKQTDDVLVIGFKV